MWPSFTRMTWLPRWRSIVQPAFRKSEPPLLRSRRGAGPSDRDLDLLRFHGEGHPSIRPDFQAGRNRLADVLDRLAAGLALRYAAGNARAFRDPDALFVLRQRDEKLHLRKSISPRIRRQKVVTRRRRRSASSSRGPGVAPPGDPRGVEPGLRDRGPPKVVRNLVRNFPRLR